jgi:hypothetical protein
MYLIKDPAVAVAAIAVAVLATASIYAVVTVQRGGTYELRQRLPDLSALLLVATTAVVALVALEFLWPSLAPGADRLLDAGAGVLAVILAIREWRTPSPRRWYLVTVLAVSALSFLLFVASMIRGL